MGTDRYEGSVGFGCQVIKHLSVSEEQHHTLLHDVLENEELIIIADLDNVRADQVIQDQLPALVIVRQRTEVVHLFLRDVRIQDLLVDPGP